MNEFGDHIRALREQQELLQRHVAAELDMDTPMLSKIERGERRAKREQVVKMAKIFKVKEDELLTLWLADQLFDLAKDENIGLKAIQKAEEKIKHGNRKHLKQ